MATIPEALSSALELHRAGNLDGARAIYRRVLDADPGNPTALYLSGVAARHAGDRAAAEGFLRRAVEAVPTNTAPLIALGDVLRDAGAAEAAVAAFRRAAVAAPGDPTALHCLGSTLCGLGANHLPDAVRQLERVCAIEPGRTAAFHDLAVGLRFSERLDEAIACEETAIARSATFAPAHVSLGNFLNERGDRTRAVASIRRGVALTPADPTALYNAGNILHCRGAAEEAVVSYHRAARLGRPAGLARAASILIEIGRTDEAEATLRHSLTLDGADLPTTIDLLATLLIGQKRHEEARALFAGLIRAPFPGGRSFAGECLVAIAQTLLDEGHAEDAATLLARVAGDSSRLFTLRSIAAFQVTLRRLGATIERPAPLAPGRPRIASSTLATHGRFAHNALEYLLLRLFAERNGLALETPDWVGGFYFDLDDPPMRQPLPPLNFPRRILNDGLTGAGAAEIAAGRDVQSPLFLLEHREEHRARAQAWLRPRPVWAPFLDPVVDRLRARGDTVVAIHIRRGDFVTFRYPITETAWYVDWLAALWPTLRRPVLYIASDDLEGVSRDFARFAPLTRADLGVEWAGLEFLLDFHAIMHADVVGISAASGFSTLAARLNTTARLFVEPDMAARRIRPFAPWTP